MDSPAESGPLTYIATADLVAYERVLRRHMKLHRDRWFRYYWRVGVYCALVGAFSSAVGQMASNQPFQWPALIGGFCAGFLFGLIWVLVGLDSSVKKRLRQTKDVSWECQIDDRAYTFRDADGVSTSIPWETIKIEFEDPDVWCIKFGRQTRFIFRGPLRSACIEEEFLRRVPS